jgi:hypothetical protein
VRVVIVLRRGLEIFLKYSAFCEIDFAVVGVVRSNYLDMVKTNIGFCC